METRRKQYLALCCVRSQWMTMAVYRSTSATDPDNTMQMLANVCIVCSTQRHYYPLIKSMFDSNMEISIALSRGRIYHLDSQWEVKTHLTIAHQESSKYAQKSRQAAQGQPEERRQKRNCATCHPEGNQRLHVLPLRLGIRQVCV